MNVRALTFATVLNCMDGRIQVPVNEAVRAEFGVTYVDTITEAGMVRFLSDEPDTPATEAALSSVRISLDAHGSRAIAVVAHYDCAGNPCDEQTQRGQLDRAVSFLRHQFPECRIVGLWVDIDHVPTVVSKAPPPASKAAL